MFTGIIQAVGHISASKPLKDGLRLTISCKDLSLDDVKIGDSIAVNGACLTVVDLNQNAFGVDVSRVTINCTEGLQQGADVNLEKAMRLTDRLGGHLVSGHVDGVGEVTKFAQIGESWLLVVGAPDTLKKYIARKGSITINGVSLTVNDVDGNSFNLNIIPHTIHATALKNLKAGSRVNLEVDLIARYIERMMQES
ncbi:MAG: riboflavin synthase [Burkholderiales bacterium]